MDALFVGVGKNEKAVGADYKSLGNQVVTKIFTFILIRNNISQIFSYSFLVKIT